MVARSSEFVVYDYQMARRLRTVAAWTVLGETRSASRYGGMSATEVTLDQMVLAAAASVVAR